MATATNTAAGRVCISVGVGVLTLTFAVVVAITGRTAIVAGVGLPVTPTAGIGLRAQQ